MRERYRRTIAFLDRHVRSDVIVSDLGCGTGIFVVEALKRGGTVNAIDFSSTALEITRKNVERHCPSGRVRYQQADVQKDELPQSDVTLAMGLVPYLTDLPAFMLNALSKTNLIYCLYVDPKHFANRIRTALPFLNVRGLQYHKREDVDRIYALNNWTLIERGNFATGYIDLARSLSISMSTT
jgi:SAM-dependent methyltransferase